VLAKNCSLVEEGKVLVVGVLVVVVVFAVVVVLVTVATMGAW